MSVDRDTVDEGVIVTDNQKHTITGPQKGFRRLPNAFGKFDKDGDGKLNSDEFKAFNEILKPGVATDEQGQPTVDYSERMDHDDAGLIGQDEMNTTGVLVPADLCDPSLKSMLDYLLLKADPLAIEAATLLKDEATSPDEKREPLFRSRPLSDLPTYLPYKTKCCGQGGHGGWFRREHVIDARRGKNGERQHANDQAFHKTLREIA